MREDLAKHIIWITAPGDTEIERAIWLASTKKAISYLSWILRDPDYDLSSEDRILIAQYLDGFYKLRPGRRALEDKDWLERELSKTPAILAADDYRKEMKRRRKRKLRIRGERLALIERFAADRGADPSTVDKILNGKGNWSVRGVKQDR